jgi:hypothetical protein
MGWKKAMTMNPERQRIVAMMRELNHAATSLNVAIKDAADAVRGREPARPAATPGRRRLPYSFSQAKPSLSRSSPRS